MIELLLPFFLGNMINEGVINKNLPNIIMSGSIMICLALLSYVDGVFNSFLAAHTSSSFGFDDRVRLFRKIQALSFIHHSQNPTSALMTRLTNDNRQIRNIVFM